MAIQRGRPPHVHGVWLPTAVVVSCQVILARAAVEAGAQLQLGGGRRQGRPDTGWDARVHGACQSLRLRSGTLATARATR